MSTIVNDAPLSFKDLTTLHAGDRRTIEAIFRHPTPHNLEWRDVVDLVSHIGSVEERSNDTFMFAIDAERYSMRKPHTKDLTSSEVSGLKHFLVASGWGTDTWKPLVPRSSDTTPALIVVVDKHEARVWRVETTDEGRATPFEAHHFLHHLTQKDHRLEDGRLGADDRAFLEEISGAVATGGKIVVISHGTGEANMAAQLTAYLETHHPETYERIFKEIVADLPNRSTAELIDLGRHALVSAQ